MGRFLSTFSARNKYIYISQYLQTRFFRLSSSESTPTCRGSSAPPPARAPATAVGFTHRLAGAQHAAHHPEGLPQVWVPRLVQGIDLPAEGAACGDGLGWRPLSRSCGAPALGAAGRALGVPRPPHPGPPRDAPRDPRPPLLAARRAEPPAPGAPSGRAQTCPEPDSLPARPPGRPPTCRSPNGQRLLLGPDGQRGGLGAGAVGRRAAEQQQPEKQQRGRRGREARHDANGTAGEAGGRREQEREEGGGRRAGPGAVRREGAGARARAVRRGARRAAGVGAGPGGAGGAAGRSAGGRALTRAVRGSSAPGAGSGPFYAPRPAPRPGGLLLSKRGGGGDSARGRAEPGGSGPAAAARIASGGGEGGAGTGQGRREGLEGKGERRG